MACVLQDRTSFFGSIPNDIVNIVRGYVARPGVVIFGRNKDRTTSLVYHSLDGPTQQYVHKLNLPSDTQYGYAAAYRWRHNRMAMVQQPKIGIPRLAQVDVLSGEEERTDWLPATVELTRSATIGLDADNFLLPSKDLLFCVGNTTTGRMTPTSMVFGARNTRLGHATLGTPNYLSPGCALIAGESGGLFYYSGFIDKATEIGRYRQTTHDQITCLHTMPQTSTFVVGYGPQVYFYDLRVGFVPTTETEASYSLWPSSTMFSEYGLVSWNSLIVGSHGFEMREHCQYSDLRMPGLWYTQPGWCLPAGFASHWATAFADLPDFVPF